MNNNNSNQNNDDIYKDLGFPSNSNNSTNNNLNVSNNNDDLTNANTNFANNIQQTNNINSNINQNIIHENNINNEIQIDNSLNTNITNTNDYKTKIPTKNIVFLVLSIINIITIVPFVIKFSVISLIFGFLDSKSTYYLCGIYVIVSIVILIKSIWNVIKYNDALKKVFKIGILVLIVLFGYKKIFPNSNINNNNNNQNVKMTNNILLNTDDIEIKVESINYTTYNVELHFNLNNKSNKYYNFHVYKLKVNDYEGMIFGTKTRSNFSAVNNYVAPHSNSSDYVMYIWYNDLKKYNIEKNEIKKLSFKLLLYESEREDASFEPEENDNYINIELK